MKFRLNSFDGCQVTDRTRNSIANDQREITPIIYNAELWFLCMTHRLIGYTILNINEIWLRLFRGDYSLYIRAKFLFLCWISTLYRVTVKA